jgi:hypothetical protein
MVHIPHVANLMTYVTQIPRTVVHAWKKVAHAVNNGLPRRHPSENETDPLRKTQEERKAELEEIRQINNQMLRNKIGDQTYHPHVIYFDKIYEGESMAERVHKIAFYATHKGNPNIDEMYKAALVAQGKTLPENYEPKPPTDTLEDCVKIGSTNTSELGKDSLRLLATNLSAAAPDRQDALTQTESTQYAELRQRYRDAPETMATSEKKTLAHLWARQLLNTRMFERYNSLKAKREVVLLRGLGDKRNLEGVTAHTLRPEDVDSKVSFERMDFAEKIQHVFDEAKDLKDLLVSFLNGAELDEARQMRQEKARKQLEKIAERPKKELKEPPQEDETEPLKDRFKDIAKITNEPGLVEDISKELDDIFAKNSAMINFSDDLKGNIDLPSKKTDS